MEKQMTLRRPFKELFADLLYYCGITTLLLRILLAVKKAHCIIMYHRIGDDAEFSGVSSEIFRMHLDVLKKFFRFVTLSECAAQLRRPREPVAAVTFDDGYKSVVLEALPVLKAEGVPATVFVTTGVVDTGALLWTDRLTLLKRINKDMTIIAAGKEYTIEKLKQKGVLKEIKEYCKKLPDRQRNEFLADLFKRAGIEGQRVSPAQGMLSWEEINGLVREGIEIGAHTVSHPILSRLSPDDAKKEIRESQQRIENMVGKPVTSFCYPNGLKEDFTTTTEALVKQEGFSCAVTAEEGLARSTDDVYALPRIYLDTASPGLVTLKLLRILLGYV